jgi:hypothetical protein
MNLLSTLKRRVILIGLVLALFWFPSFAGASRPFDAAPSARTKYNFNSGWKLYVGDPKGAEAPAFDDSGWKNLTLPHAWNEDSAFKVSIHDLPMYFGLFAADDGAVIGVSSEEESHKVNKLTAAMNFKSEYVILFPPVIRASPLSDTARTGAEVEWRFSDDAYQGSQIVFTDRNGADSVFGAELPANIFNDRLSDIAPRQSIDC